MKSRKVHRNPIFCVWAVLLCLTLITTCLLCGILAKYRTTGDDGDRSRVAELGQLKLTETTGSSYQVTPGVDIEKDPTVTMGASEVAVRVYVDITVPDSWIVDDSVSGTYTFSYMVDNDGDSTNGAELAFLSWTVADGWTYSSAASGAGSTTYTFVYEDDLAAGESLSAQSVIENNKITVSGAIYYDVYYDTVTDVLNADDLDITFSARAEQID